MSTTDTVIDAEMKAPKPRHIQEQGKNQFAISAALLTSLAVFAQEVTWNFYDAQVPPALRHYTNSAALIGLLMGMDNFLGLFIQPWMAHRSDNTRTRFGRRIPYLMIGAPIAATFYCLIPWANSLPALVASMFCFALVGNAYKGIADALIADFQAPEHRGKANAMAKLATALTIAAGSAISYFVIDQSTRIAFAIPAFLLVAGMAIVSWGLDESRAYVNAVEDGEDQQKHKFRDHIKDILHSSDRSRLSVILAVFATAGIWSAMRSQLSPYVMEVLGLTRGQAGSLVLPGGIAFLLAVLPIAFLSDRRSRISICKLGGAVFAAGCFIAFASPTLPVTTVGLVVASIGYAAFAVNGMVIMWNLAPNSLCIGAYTGFYTIASACGATTVPALVCLLVDATSWRYLMLHIGCGGLISLWLMSRVRSEKS